MAWPLPPVAGYVAATVPADVQYVSDTTLFHMAMLHTGDALQWVSYAKLNNLLDPWLFGQSTILVPPTFPPEPVTGILGQ